MSRCFPFPPPNYRKEERILTESIKLQKEQEASKDRRKEKRRDKKEKRDRSKARKENSKDSERAHKKRKHNESNELPMKDAYQIAAAKKIELHMKDVATEQLERSGLTEEHGPPCFTPEPCESSESTQTSSKGRKLETVSQHGTTIIRFKLKHRDSKPSAIVSEEPCFSGRATSKDPEPVPAEVDEPCFSGRVAKMPPIANEHSSDGMGESSVFVETGVRTRGVCGGISVYYRVAVPKKKKLPPIEMQLGESSKSHKRRRGKERKFDDLIIDWNPAPFLAGEDGVEDLGWLLDGSRRDRASSEG